MPDDYEADTAELLLQCMKCGHTYDGGDSRLWRGVESHHTYMTDRCPECDTIHAWCPGCAASKVITRQTFSTLRAASHLICDVCGEKYGV